MSKLLNSRSQWLSSDKIYPYALIGILMLGFSVRLIGLDKGVWGDETFTISMISKANLWEMLQDLRRDVHPPLHYILLYYWSKINNSEEFLRLFSVLFGVGTIAVVMSWLKQYSYLASILAGIYLATTPIMLRFSQEIRGYSLLLFVTALAFLFASSIIATPEKLTGYIGLTLSLIVAISTKLVAIMLLVPLFLFVVIQITLEGKKKYWGKIIFTFTIPCLGFIYFYSFYLNKLSQNTADYWIPNLSLYLFSSTWQYLLGLSTLFFHSYLNHILSFLFLALVTISLIFGKWQKSFSLLAFSVLFCLEIIIYSLIKTPIFWYRSLLPSLIPLFAFIALQIATIKSHPIKTASIILLATFSILTTADWITVQAYRPIEYYKTVAQLVELKWQPNNLILFYPGYISSPFEYYFENIPSETVRKIRKKANIEKIKLDLNQYLSQSTANPALISVVVRLDLNAKVEDFQKLLSALQSKDSKSRNLQAFFLISHDLDFVKETSKTNDFLAALEAEFGQPKSSQEEGGYVFAEYEEI